MIGPFKATGGRDEKEPRSEFAPVLQRARVRLRRVTQAAVVAATASTALIGLLVAQQHPGTSRHRHVLANWVFIFHQHEHVAPGRRRGRDEEDDDRSVNNDNDNDADHDVEVGHGDLGRYLT